MDFAPQFQATQISYQIPVSWLPYSLLLEEILRVHPTQIQQKLRFLMTSLQI